MTNDKRENSIKKYYENPNYCKYCGKIIHINDGDKIYEVKRKEFCNRSCSASFNNKIPKRIKKVKEKIIKRLILGNKTKGELFENRSNWQNARSAIQKNARVIFENSNEPKCCKECGYDKHYEVCHIKSVSSFSDDSLIKDINNIENLIALCPTHHWEFDNNVLNISSISG